MLHAPCWTWKPDFLLVLRRWPNLDAWFDAMEQRPTYLGIKSDFYTHVHDLPPQIGGSSPL